MKLIQPKATLWLQGEDLNAHIARCARVCYRSERKSNNDKFVEALIGKGHKSMLRHASYYYKIPVKLLDKESKLRFIHSPYCGFRKHKNFYYISTNGQYYLENICFFERYEEYLSSAEEFKQWAYTAELIRYSFCIDTQISTSRELNRVSPNTISEQSTRYVDLSKKGVNVCKPYWYDSLSWVGKLCARVAWRMETLCYKLARGFMHQQNAREFLPLATATRVVYTYNVIEWRRLLNLRYFEVTGKAHNNTRDIAAMILETLTALGYDFTKDITKEENE